MPIYEFYSPDTHRIYSFFARSLAQGRRIPRCPDSPGARMERMVSSFAVLGRNRDKLLPGESPEEAPDPAAERAMALMEKEMASLSEEPDPRQLARLMRTMGEASGKPVPPALQSMIDRLERGENPENIEEELGNAFGDLKPEETDPGHPAHRRRTVPPQRDPTLYEMGDFLD